MEVEYIKFVKSGHVTVISFDFGVPMQVNR
jgi:hypothetical protein